MKHLLLVDDAGALSELFAETITTRLGHRVSVATSIQQLEEILPGLNTIDLAIVDMSFPQEDGSGLDALASVRASQPSARLAIITQGDEWVAQLLRDAWELLPICTVISKSAPLSYQLAAISTVLETGSAPVDPAIQPLLPRESSSIRTPQRFAYLVQHAGHAKLWRALLVARDASYKEVADLAGLKLNTVKNYRVQLLPELEVHGLSDPTLRQMANFAVRCKAFLLPYIEQRVKP